jgi:hypothetical protein
VWDYDQTYKTNQEEGKTQNDKEGSDEFVSLFFPITRIICGSFLCRISSQNGRQQLVF